MTALMDKMVLKVQLAHKALLEMTVLMDKMEQTDKMEFQF